MALWLKDVGKDSDVAMSTRVRLARNADKIPFPHRIIGNKIEHEITDSARSSFSDDFSYKEMKELPVAQKRAMVEKHLVSPSLVQNPDAAVLVSDDEQRSIMLLEEDHFRIQCLLPGFQPQRAFEMTSDMDKRLNEKVAYAFDPKLGYLTSCPTNLGTGLRISVMLNLPALTLTRQISGVLGAIGKFGFTSRGMYGEGSGTNGDLYQVSNQVTLGFSEKDIVKNLESVVSKLIEHERNARTKLYETNRTQVEDLVMRSYGILKYAVKMEYLEALGLISKVNMGVGIGLIEDMSSNELYNLILDMMPATILIKNGPDPAQGEDVLRAKLIGKVFK